ncbi:DNA-deoxyinosine glycosylase [Cupriavidus sp. CuC1]|uniref:DNA-deoxyinosine glycosylase n=1 Tax=Cupriavidus sp. CuC1 TaxID=3373131 RepID=UPI0037D75B63
MEIATPTEGLAPIVDANCTHLILGTIPGDESLRLQRYYAHGANQLWQILGKVYSEEVQDEYEDRVAFLLRHGIAVWDVLRSADRKASLDSAIKNEIASDFAGLFGQFPQLRAVEFNGTTARTLFGRHVASQPGVPMEELRCVVLPSTSWTPGRHVKSPAEKQAIAELTAQLPGVDQVSAKREALRYGAEKEQIRQKAEAQERAAKDADEASEKAVHHHHRWAQAVVAVQVSIALAAITLLTRRRWLQVASYGVGAIGGTLAVLSMLHI